jgi:hypothetical protein
MQYYFGFFMLEAGLISSGVGYNLKSIEDQTGEADWNLIQTNSF